MLYLKSLKSILIAAMIIIVVESLLLLSHMNFRGDPFKLLSLQYLKGVSVERYLLLNKLDYLRGKKVDFVSIGDSSGLVSINPEVVEQHLHGKTFYNGSLQLPIGIPGYRYVTEIFLKDSNIKHIVYHLSPYQATVDDPLRVGWSPYIYSSYLAPLSFLLNIPSSQYRFWATNLVYYWGEDKMHIMEDLAKTQNSHGFLDLDFWRQGKAPDKNRPDNRDRGECNFTGWVNHQGEPVISDELRKVKAVTDKYQAKLIVIFGPSSCSAGEKIQPLIADLEAFKKNNPDVLFPAGIMNHMDVEHFDDAVHLKASAAELYSNRIGEMLQSGAEAIHIK